MSKFFTEALRNLKQTGSFVPSSQSLAKRMTHHTNFTKTLKILELGAGDGVFTKNILSKMNNDSDLYSFEINSLLFEEIDKIKDVRFHPILGSVFDVSNHLPDASIDLIVSGIPLANIKKVVKLELLENCHRLLKPGGTYVQFQYSLNDYRLIKSVFQNVSLSYTIWNFPPAFIYYAKKDNFNIIIK